MRNKYYYESIKLMRAETKKEKREREELEEIRQKE